MRRITVTVEPVIGSLVPVGVRVRLASEAAAYPFVQVGRHAMIERAEVHHQRPIDSLRGIEVIGELHRVICDTGIDRVVRHSQPDEHAAEAEPAAHYDLGAIASGTPRNAETQMRFNLQYLQQLTHMPPLNGENEALRAIFKTKHDAVETAIANSTPCTPAMGAWPTLQAATAAVASGGYYGPIGLGETRGPSGQASRTQQAQDRELARRVWDASVAMTGIDPGLRP